MAILTHKTTFLLPPNEYQFLIKQARQQGTTLGELIRTAVRKIYLGPKKKSSKSAWKKLFSMRAPISDWNKMEQEIVKGRLKNS